MRVASVPAGGPAERANFGLEITPMTRRTERPARTAGGGEMRAAAGVRAERGRKGLYRGGKGDSTFRTISNYF